MGVACQILIHKKKKSVHRAGQSVTGIIKYTLDKPTEYTAVTLSFLGTGNCSWRETDSDDQSTRYFGSEKYVTVHIDLLNKKKETATIDIGSYEYPFTFRLPEDLPSSFKNDTCTLAYRIQLKFEKSTFFSINKIFFIEIPVYGFVEPTVDGPVTFVLEKTLMKLFSAEKFVINLKAEVANICLTPGENAHLSLVVTNNTDTVPSVWTELVCHTTYKASCGRKSVSNVKIQDCNSGKTDIPKQGIAYFSQTIPTHPDFYSITTKVMQKQYKLRFNIRIPIRNINAMKEMPVVIGERKVVNPDGSVEVLKEQGSSGGSYFELGKEVTHDELLSYWEAMYEEKEEKE